MKVLIEEKNIKQVISDFDGIKAAIENCGVDVPQGTDTKDYVYKIYDVEDRALNIGRGEGYENGYSEGETAGYDKGYEDGQATAERDINPEWMNWQYFCNGRPDLAAKLKYSDTSNGTNFYGMFSECKTLTSIPALDTSNGTDFTRMFYGCYALTSIPVFNTSQGKKFSYIFYDCNALTAIPEIDTSNGTAMDNAFTRCRAITTIPKLDTSKVTIFTSMFYSCSGLTTIPEIDTSKGTSFNAMFYECKKLTSIPQLNLTEASSFSNNMFQKCEALVDLNIVGTINATGLDVSYSTLLSHDSLMSIINALADKTGVSGTFKVTLGATNYAKLTAEEILIAENKGWTVA